MALIFQDNFFIMCAADMLTCAHIYNHCFLLEGMSLSCPLPSLAGLFESEVSDGSYCKKTGNWHTWGYKMLVFSVWKQGQMEMVFYVQKVKCYNKCGLQCLDMSVQENPG